MLRVSRHNMPPMFLDSSHLFTRFTREKKGPESPPPPQVCSGFKQLRFCGDPECEDQIKVWDYIFLLIFRSSVPPKHRTRNLEIPTGGWPKWSLKQGTHVLDLGCAFKAPICKVSGWNGNFPQCFTFVSLFMTTPGGFWKLSHIQRSFDFLFF